MSVRTYNPSVRVGNWNEDLCLEEDLLKDFLDKKEKGELAIQKTHNLLQTILRPIELSPLPGDSHLHIGDKVVLCHKPTASIVSAFITAPEAHEAKQLIPGCQVSCSVNIKPCPRNIFVVGSLNDKAKQGDTVLYGEHITFSTLPNEGGELSLHSDSFSFMKHSKYSREPEVTLVNEQSYACAWRFLCHDPSLRLETEGEPVPVNTTLFVNHCKTNQDLAVHTEYCHRTPFGLEYEVTACTKYNKHKFEDVHNQFMILVGDPEQILKKNN